MIWLKLLNPDAIFLGLTTSKKMNPECYWRCPKTTSSQQKSYRWFFRKRNILEEKNSLWYTLHFGVIQDITWHLYFNKLSSVNVIKISNITHTQRNTKQCHFHNFWIFKIRTPLYFDKINDCSETLRLNFWDIHKKNLGKDYFSLLFWSNNVQFL